MGGNGVGVRKTKSHALFTVAPGTIESLRVCFFGYLPPPTNTRFCPQPGWFDRVCAYRMNFIWMRFAVLALRIVKISGAFRNCGIGEQKSHVFHRYC